MFKHISGLLLNQSYTGILQGYDTSPASNSKSSKTAIKLIAFPLLFIDPQESYCKPLNNSDHGKL